MKSTTICFLVLVCLLALTGCSSYNVEFDGIEICAEESNITIQHTGITCTGFFVSTKCSQQVDELFE